MSGLDKEPDQIELGEFLLRRNESLTAKIRQLHDRGTIYWSAPYISNEMFPEELGDIVQVSASAIRFKRRIPDHEITEWCTRNEKIRARPKDGIDIVSALSREKLDPLLPILIAGQFSVSAKGLCHMLCFEKNNDGSLYLDTGFISKRQIWKRQENWMLVIANDRPR